MITFNCPKCRKEFKSKDEYEGRQFSCSNCGQDILIPTLQELRQLAAIELAGSASVSIPATSSVSNQTIQFSCPNCNAAIEVSDKAAGSKGKCHSCKQTIRVPKLATSVDLPVVQTKPPPAPVSTQSELGHPPSQQWHVSKAGEQFGPFTFSHLKNLAESGQLARKDLLWKEGLEEWVEASSVKGLFPPIVPPPVPRVSPAESSIESATVDRGKSGVNSTPPIASHQSEWSSRHKQRIGILIASGLGVSATFLPWVHAPLIGSVAGTAGDGWITLVLFLPGLILALRDEKSNAIRGRKRLAIAIPAILAAILGAWKIFSFGQLKSAAPDDNPFAKAMSASVQIGVGLYLLVAAGIAVAVVAWQLDEKGEEKPNAAKAKEWTRLWLRVRLGILLTFLLYFLWMTVYRLLPVHFRDRPDQKEFLHPNFPSSPE